MLTVAQIAALLKAPVEGDAERRLERGAPLETAGPDEISFGGGAREKAALAATRAGCLILPDGVAPPDGCAVIRAAKPRDAFARALRELQPPPRPAPGVHASAVVDPEAELGVEVAVGPHAVVEVGVRLGDRVVVGPGCWVGAGVQIGADSRLAAGVRIYPETLIGERAILHAGAVVGADGFGFVFENGRYEKFPQVGRVRIGDDVEIGANSCIDRGALGETVLEDGVKLDNLVHIAHNCRLGKHVVIAAQTGLSGGVVVEDYVVMGGQVGIGDKARIGRQAVLGGQAGVLTGKTVAGGEQYWGTPVRPVREHLKNLGRVERLAELMTEVRALRARLDKLEEAE